MAQDAARPVGSSGAEPGGSQAESTGKQPSPLKRQEIRVLIGSRMATALALTTLSFGAMIFLAQNEAPQIAISLIGATRYLAAVLFGVSGGIVADTASKRTALIAGYGAMALLCLLTPIVFGANLWSLIILVFCLSVIGQIVSPALKATVALVARAAEIAAVAAILAVAGGLGSATGSALLAPVLVSVGGIRLVMIITGVILALGSWQLKKLPVLEHGLSMPTALRQVKLRETFPSFPRTMNWILEHDMIAIMVLTGAVVIALFDGLNSLIPVYVRDVLDANPAQAVYIFAPGAIGFALGIVLGPPLIAWAGARRTAAVGLVAIAIGSVMFGLIDQIGPALAPISPLNLFSGLFGEINRGVLAASVIVIPFSFGSTIAGAAVQTFVNQNAPVESQGSIFGMGELLENGMTLTAILVFGVIATLIGPRTVFIIAPVLIVVMVAWLIQSSFQQQSEAKPTLRQVIHDMVLPPEDKLQTDTSANPDSRRT